MLSLPRTSKLMLLLNVPSSMISIYAMEVIIFVAMSCVGGVSTTKIKMSATWGKLDQKINQLNHHNRLPSAIACYVFYCVG